MTRQAQESAKIEKAQAEVVRLLQSISRRLGMLGNTDDMSKGKLDEMNDDLEFKQTQLEHSLSTSERLQVTEGRKAETSAREAHAACCRRCRRRRCC